MRRLAPLVLLACGSVAAPPNVPATPTSAPWPTAPVASTEPPAPVAISTVAPLCGGPKLRVRFFDVSQALSALVELPDGRHILVDTGDIATRTGCGAPCQTAHQHLVSQLGVALGGKPIDLLWITHPHSDHIGGAADLIDRFPIKAYVDNGRDLGESEIKKTRNALASKGVQVKVVEPGHAQIPIPDAAGVKLSAIAPAKWLAGCKDNRNLCSIMLRIDYCTSSILFTGDAETEEEALIDPKGAATLVQIGHHGSDSSTSAPFLAKLAPKYAVISAGKKGEGMNKTYCHPRVSIVKALTTALGGAGSRTIQSFDAKVKCSNGADANWIDVPSSDRIWATERDGDVTLSTTGDGTFTKE